MDSFTQEITECHKSAMKLRYHRGGGAAVGIRTASLFRLLINSSTFVCVTVHRISMDIIAKARMGEEQH